MNLNKCIKSNYDLCGAIIGTLMGDTCVFRVKNKDLKEIGNANFQYTHCPEQEEYADIKAKIFEMGENVKIKKKQRVTHLKKTNKDYLQYSYVSNKNSFATEFRELMYVNGTKIVTDEILNKITDFGLFLWYLDDGYLNVRYYTDTNKIKEYRVVLHTSSFTLEEVKLIQKWFERRYNINPNINKKEKGFVLYFNSSKTRDFMKIIDKYYDIVPCLKRKFLKTYI